MLSSARSIAATDVNQDGARVVSGLSVATSFLPSLSVHWKLSISPFCTWFLSSWLITAYSPTSAWSAISGAMKIRVSFSSRFKRAECSAAPSATSSAVCTPPPVMMAMPTASIRRETSPQFFQNRIPLMLLMVAPRIPGGRSLLDLRRPVKLAVVVVIAVFGGDEAQLAIALQQLGPGLEHLAPFRILRHVDQRSPHLGDFVGGHLRIGHDAQVLVDLGGPQRAISEGLAARVARQYRAVHASGGDLVDPELRGGRLLVAGEHDLDVHLVAQQRVHRQPVAGEGVRRHEGNLLAVQVLQRVDRRILGHHDLRADAGAGGARDDLVADAVALRGEEVVGVLEVVTAALGDGVAFLRRLRQLELERHSALLADVRQDRIPVLSGQRDAALVQDVKRV